MGPAHSNHADIAEKGDGAFSHWRHTITAGPWCKSMLRFSTPRNMPLKKVRAMVAVVFPMAPPFGWIEFNRGKHVVHQEIFRELFLQTFPRAGVARPHLIDAAEETVPDTRYVWRVGGNHEFELPLKEGELYEKRLPYQIVEWYAEFERRGGILYPPPESYLYYQNKVGLARLFIERKVKIPPTWVITSLDEAKSEMDKIQFPVVIKDPYGFSSLGLLQAAGKDEFMEKMELYFSKALPDVEAIVQSKVVALKEARVTYVDGRPFHGYWRIRHDCSNLGRASNLGGFQDFDFPLQGPCGEREAIAPYVAEFANRTGIPVGGVDFIWEEEDADVKTMPYTLEVSGGAARMVQGQGPDAAFVIPSLCRTEFMILAVIDRYRSERKHLFVDIDNVVSLSMERVRRWKGDKRAYMASEVIKDLPVPGAADALRRLRERYFIRFLTARGTYEDAFNVTQTWLELNDFDYDDLIVVDRPQSKVCHFTSQTLLVDDFTLGHEKKEPSLNQKFMDQLSAAKLPFVQFPLGGSNLFAFGPKTWIGLACASR
ncbi:cofF [Symbiodinium natans]|uniref:CofF protein n=1 Tax=Symbiodinium natans TaxID=878477 RepID=A0A812I6V2_9DINO|nr:cofF [Symbiodinium natans]